MRKKFTPPHRLKAFTLSEVLITLVIIGIIAAITVPTLIANSRKEETTARLKKFYSTLQQVTYRAKADGNDWDYWAEEASSASTTTPDVAKEFAETHLLPYLVYSEYKLSSNAIWVYLNDGSYFYSRKGTCLDFYFDVNGKRKPNVWGRDIFAFLYCPKSTNAFTPSQVIPYHTKSIDTREKALESCKNDKPSCSTLLFFDNWEFKEDYPYNL